MSNAYNLEIFQGSTFEMSLIVKDSAGALLNLTGYSAAMQIRSSYSAATAAVSISSPSSGITINTGTSTINVSISAATTAGITIDRNNGKPPKGSFVYDLEATDGSGKVSKLLFGEVTVIGEVTR
jgi:hypothetical protein